MLEVRVPVGLGSGEGALPGCRLLTVPYLVEGMGSSVECRL